MVEAPVLVDAEGEPLVLATEEAAELLIAPDPYFTTGRRSHHIFLYRPRLRSGYRRSTCPVAQSISIQLRMRINYIDTNAMDPDDGFLHVQKATYTGNITIDYIAKPNLSSLTGLIGEPTAGLYPTISGSLSLLNLTNGFTLTGFNITGGTLIQDSIGQFHH